MDDLPLHAVEREQRVRPQGDRAPRKGYRLLAYVGGIMHLLRHDISGSPLYTDSWKEMEEAVSRTEGASRWQGVLGKSNRYYREPGGEEYERKTNYKRRRNDRTLAIVAV